MFKRMSSIKKEIKVSLHQRPWLVYALLKLYSGSRHTYVRARSNWKCTYSI